MGNYFSGFWGRVKLIDVIEKVLYCGIISILIQKSKRFYG